MFFRSSKYKCTIMANESSIIKTVGRWAHFWENKTYSKIILVLGPSQSSARLGFGLSFWEKKLGSARLAMPSKKLSSARLAISCKKSSVQLGLLYDLKNRVTLKTKNELIFNIFATFLRYNLEDINKSVFFLLKSCIL